MLLVNLGQGKTRYLLKSLSYPPQSRRVFQPVKSTLIVKLDKSLKAVYYSLLSIMLWLNILLIVFAIALVTSILLQNRSAGLGGAFGGAGGDGFHVRRGSEKTLFQLTIVLSVLFLAVAAAHLFL
mgnify:CR=1 FL=1